MGTVSLLLRPLSHSCLQFSLPSLYMRDYSPSAQSIHFSETQLVNTTIIQLINMEFLNVILMYPDLEIPKWIFTCIILLCVVMSNVFFTLFRAYQASLPIHKYVLLNILFSHLSIL